MRRLRLSPTAIALLIGVAASSWPIVATMSSSFAAVEEEDAPPASAPTTAAPIAQPSGEPAPAPHDYDHPDDWERAPVGGSGPDMSPAAHVPAAQGAPKPGATPPAAIEPEAQQGSGASMTPLSSPSPSMAAAPSASASNAALTGPPPALDVSAMDTTVDLGARPLDREIKQARSPSMAASLRLTEQARKELVKGSNDAALRSLARAVSIDPGDPFEYYYLGRAHMMRKNYAQALTFFQRARLGFGDRPEWLGETLSYEGACDEQLGRTLEAAKAYQQAVNVSPGNFRARIGYGRLSSNLTPATSLDAPPPATQNAPGAPPVSPPAPPPPESSPPPAE
jgi:hypothetical protein